MDDAEYIARILHAQGVPATRPAIEAALRGFRALDLAAELQIGYQAACARWGALPTRECLDGVPERATVPAKGAR